MTKTITRRGQATSAKKAPIRQLRGIPEPTRTLLHVRAGGRCEFAGCNKYLMEHPLTHAQGNFGQGAHIVAFSARGPRGEGARPKDIHQIDNLMLLCADCHKSIDADPARYAAEVLRAYKRDHEARIYHLTGLGPDHRTAVLQLKCRVADQLVDIPIADVTSAVAPHYPSDAHGTVIDITTLSDRDDHFLPAATEKIERELDRFYSPGMVADSTRHVSVFALAPIPVLVFFGSRLSNKIATDVYQRHRDPETWAWKTGGSPLAYRIRIVQRGHSLSKAALLLSISGRIPVRTLPKIIDRSYWVYELSLKGVQPSPVAVRLRQDADSFRGAYRQMLQTIAENHKGRLRKLHLFPAVPAPLAILCGRELLPKVDPPLWVYDYDIHAGGFSFQLEVTHERRE